MGCLTLTPNLVVKWCQMRVWLSKMQVFSFDRYIFRMKFSTGFTIYAASRTRDFLAWAGHLLVLLSLRNNVCLTVYCESFCKLVFNVTISVQVDEFSAAEAEAGRLLSDAAVIVISQLPRGNPRRTPVVRSSSLDGGEQRRFRGLESTTSGGQLTQKN